MKTELKVLFYSPVAWLILIIFTLQTSLNFTDILSGQIRSQALGYNINNLTYTLFCSPGGTFPGIQNYLYLYIPLLTMGLMSREFSSGSIRLLKSSPTTDLQIIVGKYLAIVVYALLLVLILSVYVFFCWYTVEHFELPVALTGVAGLFLLAITYGAIGLFMSVLTSYQVVAAIGTLVSLAILNYIGRLGQNIDVVRDITYWLSVPKRISGMIDGLWCSQDLIYFPIVILLFITLSFLKLKGTRINGFSWRSAGKYTGVIFLALLSGYISSRPHVLCYKDVTYVGRNTLSQQSQAIMEQIPDRLTITTYVNLLDKNGWLGMPENRNYDLEIFQKYLRFKPDTELKYVYYYDTVYNSFLDEQYPGMKTLQKAEKLMNINGYDPGMFLTPAEIRKQIDLLPEGNRMVRSIERENGAKTFLRMFNDSRKQPEEYQITTAMKRLTGKPPKIGFTTGHGERSITDATDRHYGYIASPPFRNSLINMGFDVIPFRLAENRMIPGDVDILVIADPQTAFSEEENQKLEAYIGSGGNLFIGIEPERVEFLKGLLEKLGITISKRYLKQNKEAWDSTLIMGRITSAAAEQSKNWRNLRQRDRKVIFPGACPVILNPTLEFDVIPLIVSTGQNAPLLVELRRRVGNKKQSIIIAADADFMSTGEISRTYNGLASANFSAVTELFSLLCDYRYPVSLSWPDPIDDEVFLSMDSIGIIQLFFLGLLPGCLLLSYIFVWRFRHKR